MFIFTIGDGNEKGIPFGFMMYNMMGYIAQIHSNVIDVAIKFSKNKGKRHTGKFHDIHIL